MWEAKDKTGDALLSALKTCNGLISASDNMHERKALKIASDSLFQVHVARLKEERIPRKILYAGVIDIIEAALTEKGFKETTTEYVRYLKESVHLATVFKNEQSSDLLPVEFVVLTRPLLPGTTRIEKVMGILTNHFPLRSRRQ